MQAYDRLISYFDSDKVRRPAGVGVTPAETLKTIAPSSFSHEGPHWSEPRAPRWRNADGMRTDVGNADYLLVRVTFAGFTRSSTLVNIVHDSFEPEWQPDGKSYRHTGLD